MDDVLFTYLDGHFMHKYFLYSGVTASLVLCLTGAVYVNAQTNRILLDNRAIINTNPVVNKYFTSTGTYSSANIDPQTEQGTLSASKTDVKYGKVITDFLITPQTTFLRKYGGSTTLSDFKLDEELSIYAQRNTDGSLTAITVTDNNLWFLDPVISIGEISAIDLEKNTLSVIDSASKKTYAVAYTDETDIQKPKAVSGTESDLVVGKNIRVRGLVRKTGSTTNIEQAYVIWILPEHGE